MKTQIILLPRNQRLLEDVGMQIQLARIRRQLSAEQVAERAGIGRSTLHKIEKGNPGVAIGNILQVLFVLGLEKDMLQLAGNDILGRKLQDAGILSGKRAPKRSSNGQQD
jgi:transcriptional regulator with XRE-family HTH domain